MHANEAEVRKEFDSEVRNLCDVLGAEGTPKYAFRVYDEPHSHVRPRLFRSPIVEIGLDYHEESHVCAGEAGHVVYRFAREQQGLRNHAGYGEVTDYMNRVRRMAEDGEHKEAELHRNSFASIEPFIEEFARLARQDRPNEMVSELFARQMAKYGGESIDHVYAIAHIRLAFSGGMQEPEHIGKFLKTLVTRDTDVASGMIQGDFTGVLHEFEYFQKEPVRIMQGKD